MRACKCKMFPSDYTVRLPNREIVNWKDPVEKTMYDLIMADCWGIQVQKSTGKTLSILDSYAEGPDTRYDDMAKNLIESVELGDSIIVYMFGQDGYKVVFKRTIFGFRIKCFASPNYTPDTQFCCGF